MNSRRARLSAWWWTSEIMLSAATREVVPVTRLNDTPVGDGRPGPVWRALHGQLQQYKQELAGKPW